MKLEIETDGEVHNTKLYMNGREVPFKEFDIKCSKLKKGTGVKMQLVVPGRNHLGNDFMSFYKGDFARMDDLDE